MENHIKKAQRGDGLAFRHLFDAYASMVYAICLRYMKDNEIAKDMMQEVFIRMYSRLGEFRFEGSFEGWLRRLTVNFAIDEIRKSKNWHLPLFSEKLEEHMEDGNSDDIFSNLAAGELLKLINELPPAYRVVFNLYVIEGYKHHEIASMLGISEGTSKSNLHDARKLLQKRVKKQ